MLYYMFIDYETALLLHLHFYMYQEFTVKNHMFDVVSDIEPFGK